MRFFQPAAALCWNAASLKSRLVPERSAGLQDCYKVTPCYKHIKVKIHDFRHYELGKYGRCEAHQLDGMLVATPARVNVPERTPYPSYDTRMEGSYVSNTEHL